MTEDAPHIEPKEKTGKSKSWLKKMGWGAFLFFLIKGIAWIVLAILAAMGIKAC